MVPLIIKNDDWKGWALGITIAVIGVLSTALAGGTFTLVREMRSEIMAKFEKVDAKNAEQDKCLAIVEANQKERLERERLEILKIIKGK